MSFGIREVNKHDRCPVCNHEDWCGWLPIEDGELLVCKRSHEHVTVLGADGNYYVFSGLSRSGNAMYEEANQKKRRDDAWMESKGYKKSANSTHREYKNVSELERKPKLQVVDQILPKSHKELDKIYRYLLELLVLDDVHKKYLKAEGWSDELIETNHIRSFPERDFTRFKHKNFFSKNKYRKTLAKTIIEKYGSDSLVGVPGAYIDRNDNWTFEGPKGIVFPIYDADGYIYRLRIRMDFMDVNRDLTVDGGNTYYDEGEERYYLEPMKGFYTIQDGKKEFIKQRGKYRNLSSYKEDDEAKKNGLLKNIFYKGCESGNAVGVYCNPQRDNMYIGFVTEGEKKGIFCNDKLRAPFLSLPGVNSWYKLLEGEKGQRDIDKLRRRGVEMLIIAYDADKNTNKAVLDNEKFVIEELKKEGFKIGIANWSVQLGKGLDDLLANGFQPSYVLVA